MKLRGRYMNVIIANHWLRRRKKFGPTLNKVITKTIRKHISLIGLLKYDGARE